MSTALLVVGAVDELAISLAPLKAPSNAQQAVLPLPPIVSLNQWNISRCGQPDWQNVKKRGQMLQIMADAGLSMSASVGMIWVLLLLAIPIVGVFVVLACFQGVAGLDAKPFDQQQQQPRLPGFSQSSRRTPLPVATTTSPAMRSNTSITSTAQVEGQAESVGASSPPALDARLNEAPSSAERTATQAAMPSATRRLLTTSIDSDNLCEALVVQEKEGVTLAIPGKLSPEPQDEVFEVQHSLHPVDLMLKTIGRIFVEEKRGDGWIIFESSLQAPIGIMDMSRCRGTWGSGRRVMISRGAARGAAANTPFAIVTHDILDGGLTVYRSRSDDQIHSAPLRRVIIEDQGSNNREMTNKIATIRDMTDRVVARIEPNRLQGDSPALMIHIACGEDASLVILSVIAAIKLNRYNPAT